MVIVAIINPPVQDIDNGEQACSNSINDNNDLVSSGTWSFMILRKLKWQLSKFFTRDKLWYGWVYVNM